MKRTYSKEDLCILLRDHTPPAPLLAKAATVLLPAKTVTGLLPTKAATGLPLTSQIRSWHPHPGRGRGEPPLSNKAAADLPLSDEATAGFPLVS